MSKDNKVLKNPEILDRIAEIRKKFAGTEEELTKFTNWEEEAKKALIVLSMEGHDGIKILINKAKEEIRNRNKLLMTVRPVNFSPDGLAEYALANSFHFQVIDLYLWFLALFTDAHETLEDIDKEIKYEQENQVEDEEINN